MKISGLLEGLDFKVLQGNVDENILGIAHDSRYVVEEGLFVCISGFASDGHDYAKEVVEKGVRALLVEKPVEIDDNQIVIVQVEDTRVGLAHIANKYYNRPTSQFGLVGVTGTNGKTSTVFLIDRILQGAGKKTGVIGTIENRIDNKPIATSHTTPDALALQKLFSDMVEANVNDVVMEVSSHALDLKRVHGAEFDVAVFTNLTLDHLDYHKTMENYRDAKMKLFEMASKGVVNVDDEVGRYILAHTHQDNVITYGIDSVEADLRATDVVVDIAGTHFSLTYENKTYRVDLQTPGKFSVYNGLAAIGAALFMGVDIKVIQMVLAENSTIRGRFETMKSPKGDYYAIVDYAHAPDGLENVLKTIQGVAKGRIITVFGCGGDRDRSKRPVMGEIAGRYSDLSIITSDNPRTEDPASILDEVEVGMLASGGSYEKIVDRREGIRRGLSLAKDDDIVLVAGKGHEDYQIIGTTKNHFDDKEVIADFFEEA